MREFLNMGGYAFYVWSAYTVAAVVLVANVIYPWRRRRQLLREISKLSPQDLVDDSET